MESVDKGESQVKEEVVDKGEITSLIPRGNFSERKNIILKRIVIDELPYKINKREKGDLIDEFAKVLIFASFLILIICIFVITYSRSKLESTISKQRLVYFVAPLLN